MKVTVELLWEDCGGVRGFQLACGWQHRQPIDVMALDVPFALIGRKKEVDVPIFDSRISRRHAYLQWIDGNLFCIDLRSAATITLGNRESQSGWLQESTSILSGPLWIWLDSVDGSAPLAQSTLEDPLAIPKRRDADNGHFFLRFFEGTANAANWPMRPALALVGRSATCTVRAPNPSVSRFHCCLFRRPRGIWVIDLQGRDGTWINGERVRFGLLEVGDQLRFGNITCRLGYTCDLSVPPEPDLRGASRPADAMPKLVADRQAQAAN